MRYSRSRIDGARQHDRVLQLGLLDRHVLADRRVGPDVGVGELRPAADDRRAAHGRALEPHALLDHNASLDARVDQLAVHALGHVVEDQPVCLEHVLHLAGVLPPAVDDVRVHAQAAVDERLDRVGDLQLVSPRRLDRTRRVEDRGGEHVDADEREVGLRLLGLLDQARDAPVVELGHAVVLGVGHRGEQDQRVRLLGAEGVDQLDDAVAQQVVAQVHHERRVAQVGLGGQHGVRESERRLLLDVLDRDAEALTVARRPRGSRCRSRAR